MDGASRRGIARMAWTLLAAWLLAAPGVYAGAPERLARVIANARYGPALGALRGPHGDAGRVAQALSRRRFQVARANDVGLAELQATLDAFVVRVERASSRGGAVAFVYYAGHGAAEDPRGENYLLPVDARSALAAQLHLQAMPLDRVFSALHAAKPQVAMLVADMWRNVPGTRGKRGLVPPLEAPTNTLMAFATDVVLFGRTVFRRREADSLRGLIRFIDAGLRGRPDASPSHTQASGRPRSVHSASGSEGAPPK
jgi:hypothetical protein